MASGVASVHTCIRMMTTRMMTESMMVAILQLMHLQRHTALVYSVLDIHTGYPCYGQLTPATCTPVEDIYLKFGE